MDYWSWWMSGLALAFIMVFHWLTTKRMMAVSGRFTGLINRLREGPKTKAPEMSQADLLAALQGVTAEEFGENAVSEQRALPQVSDAVPELKVLPPSPPSAHLVFLGSLIVGGAISALLARTFRVVPTLSASGFQEMFGENPITAFAVLFSGGMLVGFGTRMSGGCTSGHGLCGVSRAQPGSLVATASFFGAGIATAFLLELL